MLQISSRCTRLPSCHAQDIHIASSRQHDTLVMTAFVRCSLHTPLHAQEDVMGSNPPDTSNTPGHATLQSL